MNIKPGRFMLCFVSFLIPWVWPADAQDSMPAKAPSADEVALRENVPIEVSVVLSTLAEDDSIQHQIVDQEYRINISFRRSMLGVKKLRLSVDDAEPGQWSTPMFTGGALIKVTQTGTAEPMDYVVEPVHALERDPAAIFESEVITRVSVPDGVVKSQLAKDAIARLVDQYAQTDHVLKLPRSASSRLNPEDTLRRLCRWIAYDKLFKQLQLDTRPIATETEAKNTYEQVVDLLRGNPLTADQSAHLLSPEELQRIEEAFQFTYSVGFTPSLTADQPDENWRQASRVAFGGGHVGQVLWRGVLRQDHHSTAWLAFRTELPDDAVDITETSGSKDLKWVFVNGADGWRYVRLRNQSEKSATPYQMRVQSRKQGSEISISSSTVDELQFPF